MQPGMTARSIPLLNPPKRWPTGLKGPVTFVLLVCFCLSASRICAQAVDPAATGVKKHHDASNSDSTRENKLVDKAEHKAEKLLKHYPEADLNGDGRLSDEEARTYLALHPQALREKKFQKHPKLDRDHDGQLSDDELKAARDKHEAKLAARSLTQRSDSDQGNSRPLIESGASTINSKNARRMADAASRPADASGEAGAFDKKAAKQARKEAKYAGSASTKSDPWTHYVEKFCNRYLMDTAQRATAQSILRECLERRASLPVQDSDPIDSGHKKAKASAGQAGSDRDRLFHELKQKLEGLPTASQRAATRPAVEPATPPAR